MFKTMQKSSVIYYTSRRSMGVLGRLFGKEPPRQAPHVALNMSKQELIARQNENDNPFETYMIKPEAGIGMSPNQPILIPSNSESRMIGCSCESDYNEVVWFKVSKGGPQKCDCGYYFKLVEHDPLDARIKPKYGKGLGSGASQFI